MNERRFRVRSIHPIITVPTDAPCAGAVTRDAEARINHCGGVCVVNSASEDSAQLLTLSDMDDIPSPRARDHGISMSIDSPGTSADHLRTESRWVGDLLITRSLLPAGLRLVVLEDRAYLLVSARTGRVLVDTEGTRREINPTVAALSRPSRRPRLVVAATASELTQLRIRRQDLERRLEDLIGDYITGPVELESRLACDGHPAWSRLLRVFDGVFDDRASDLHRPMVVEPLCEAMITSLLLAADHPYSKLLRRPVAPARPRHIRVVIDAIQSEPERPYTVSALARLAGVSVRSLQGGFRRHVGMSPLAYLRRVRLARVHHLLRSDGRVTVSEAAHRCGFTHLGRFTAEYAAVFGTAPSGTRSAQGDDLLR